MRAELFERLQQLLGDDRLVAVATVLDGEGIGQQILIAPSETSKETVGSLDPEPLQDAVLFAAQDRLRSLSSGRTSLEVDGKTYDLFIEVMPPRPCLIIVGAVHVAIPLIHFANRLDFRTVVVDPRTAFLTPERFAHADALITEWPKEALESLQLHENSYVALLSHDLKLDLPALEVALRRPTRYVGALGSRKTHSKRISAMQDAGFTEDEIAKIHNPIGLPLGGRRAEEMAVSILAEIVAVRHDRRAQLG